MVTCIHRKEREKCFLCMLLATELQPVCQNCGNDVVMAGEGLCSECLNEENLYWDE